MHFLEQSISQHHDVTVNDTCTYNVTVNGIQLDACRVPVVDFYQWNDFGELL